MNIYLRPWSSAACLRAHIPCSATSLWGRHHVAVWLAWSWLSTDKAQWAPSLPRWSPVDGPWLSRPFLASRQHSLFPVFSLIHPSVRGHLWREPMAMLENISRHAEWTRLELSSLIAPACLFCRPARLGELARPMFYNHGGNRAETWNWLQRKIQFKKRKSVLSGEMRRDLL